MVDVNSTYAEARHALRAICPKPILNWREARYYGRYGEIELHLLEFLCRRDRDAIDVGANDGSYVHYMRRCARHVVAYEPMPHLAAALRAKFPARVQVEAMALSDDHGTVELRMPLVDGIPIEGCSTISFDASATYAAYRSVEVPMARLDDVYKGDVGFIKIDVEGHEQAVLDGAVATIRRCMPRLLVGIYERLSPGGIERARSYFTEFGYRGFFIHNGNLKPMERFSVERMQRPDNLPKLTAPLPERERFGRYLYNFIFLPPDEPQQTLWKMSERLYRLSAH
jgi:FkbM family methyltransferase